MSQPEQWLPIAIVVMAPFVGSFLGVLVERLPQNWPVFWSRSECSACGRRLAALDMIPIASWAALKGRCRYCKGSIGSLPVAMELLAFAVAIWALLAVPSSMTAVTAIFGWILLPLAVIDWRHQRLPDALTVTLAIAGLAAISLIAPFRLPDHAIGMVAGYLAMSGIGFAYSLIRGRSGLGQGDAKLLGALGAWIGWEGLAGIVLLASVLALLITSIQHFRERQISLSTKIPFGVYLSVGGWLVWLYGPLYIGY